MIVDHGGLKQCFSLFKTSSISVRISAGWTIRHCLVSIKVRRLSLSVEFRCDVLSLKQNAELIRSFDGIFYFLIENLNTDRIDLLAVTLAIIAEIVRDKDNREIFTDLGVVTKLVELSNFVLKFSFQS